MPRTDSLGKTRRASFKQNPDFKTPLSGTKHKRRTDFIPSVGQEVSVKEEDGSWSRATVSGFKPKESLDFTQQDFRRKRKRARTVKRLSTDEISEVGGDNNWILVKYTAKREPYQEWILYEKDGLPILRSSESLKNMKDRNDEISSQASKTSKRKEYGKSRYPSRRLSSSTPNTPISGKPGGISRNTLNQRLTRSTAAKTRDGKLSLNSITLKSETPKSAIGGKSRRAKRKFAGSVRDEVSSKDVSQGIETVVKMRGDHKAIERIRNEAKNDLSESEQNASNSLHYMTEEQTEKGNYTLENAMQIVQERNSSYRKSRDCLTETPMQNGYNDSKENATILSVGAESLRGVYEKEKVEKIETDPHARRHELDDKLQDANQLKKAKDSSKHSLNNTEGATDNRKKISHVSDSMESARSHTASGKMRVLPDTIGFTRNHPISEILNPRTGGADSATSRKATENKIELPDKANANADIMKEKQELNEMSDNNSNTKIGLTSKSFPSVDARTVDFSKLMPPIAITKLAGHLNLSLAQIFKDIGVFGRAGNAGYSWTSNKHCHRQNIFASGVKLSDWYYKTKHKDLRPIVFDDIAREAWANDLKAKLLGEKTPSVLRDRKWNQRRYFVHEQDEPKLLYITGLTKEVENGMIQIILKIQFNRITEYCLDAFENADLADEALRIVIAGFKDWLFSAETVNEKGFQELLQKSPLVTKLKNEVLERQKARQAAANEQEEQRLMSRRTERANAIATNRMDSTRPSRRQTERQMVQRGSRNDREESTSISIDESQQLSAKRSGMRVRRKKEQMNIITNTAWLTEGYPIAFAKGASGSRKVYHTSFKFIDTRESCGLLDHVLVYREDDTKDDVDGEVNHCVGKNNGIPKDYYVGQIEALWEENDGNRYARIAWFYWPEETEMGRTTENGLDELYSSNDVDVNLVSNIACKVEVSSYESYLRWKNSQKSNPLADNQGVSSKWKSDNSEQTGERATNSNEVELEEGARIRKLRLAELYSFKSKRRLYVKHHYNHKSSKLVGTEHASRALGTGKCFWVAPFLFATRTSPDVSSLFDNKDTERNQCPYSLAVVDTRKLDLNGEKGSLEDVVANCNECCFCFQKLPFELFFECVVCKDVKLCVDCFSIGRQGLIPARASSIKYLHRAFHPFRVSRPRLNCKDTDFGIKALEYVCKAYGGLKVEYELISIARGPLSSKENRAPAPRFCYGLKLDPLPETDVRDKGRRLGTSSRVMSKVYGKSIEEAKGMAAIEALQQVFGIANNLSLTLLSRDWTSFEVIRLLEAIETYGLAWDPAASIVTTKSVLQNRDFYNQKLLPAWAANDEWARKLQLLSKDQKYLRRLNEGYTKNLPQPSAVTVKVAVEDAVSWAKKVDEMVTRRSKLARKNKRGLSIALVDNLIVYAPRPSSFGSYATSETQKLVRNEIESPSPENMQADLFDDSVCVVCKKTDRPDKIVLCDGCDEEFHINCLDPPLASVPEGDWFCDNCMEDRAYLYDHCSWGKSGKTLCEFADKNEKWDVEHHAVPKSADQWLDNEKVLQNATIRAIKMGFGSDMKDFASKEKEEDGSNRRRRRRKTEADKKSTPKRKVMFNPEDSDVQNAVAWATRHYADATVAALEAANRGLAQALHSVISQRDALAIELEKAKTELRSLKGS